MAGLPIGHLRAPKACVPAEPGWVEALAPSVKQLQKSHSSISTFYSSRSHKVEGGRQGGRGADRTHF